MSVRALLPMLAIALTLGACTPAERAEGVSRPVDLPAQTDITEQRSGTPEETAPTARSGSVLAPPGSVDGPIDLPREIWRFAAGAPVTASPVTAGGVVVAGFADFTLRGLSATDGTQLWLRDTASVPASIAVAVDGSTVFAADLGSVSRLSVQDGSAEWTVPVGVAGGAQIRVTSRAVYVPGSDGHLSAIGAETGEPLWVVDLAPNSEAPVVGVIGALDGVLYACTGDGGVAAVTAADGTIRWRADLAEELSAGPVVTAGGVIVASVDGGIHWLHRDTGEQAGIRVVSELVASLPIVVDQSIFVFGASGGVFALDSGAPDTVAVGTAPARASAISPFLRLGSDLAGQPALLDSRILVTDAAGRLRGLDAATGLETWVIPIHLRVIGGMGFDGSAVFAAGAGGTILAVVFDVAPDSAPLLTGDRLWDLPADGRFRMESRFIEFSRVADVSGVVEWSIYSSVTDDALVMTILDARGNVLATNMGKVVLQRSTRAVMEAGEEFRVRVERSYPDRQAIVTLISEIVQ